MKKSCFAILLGTLLLAMAPIAVLAAPFPHDSDPGGNNYLCDVCHNTHNVLGTTGFNNVCTTCHSPSDPKAGGKPFYQSDAANPYGSILNGYSGGITPAKIKQTSHNWIGSDVNPKAGAQAPTDPSMNSTRNIQNKLLCVRCHNVHGAQSSSANSAPFLRTLNNNDQMCRDCHKVRDTSNVMMGTHPINKRYTSATSKVVTQPTKYNAVPVNVNPSNPTSALRMVNGAIQCTTCHGTHYSDSRSGTVDGRATYNNLSASTGGLLRTDVYGKNPSGDGVNFTSNICQNCHVAKNHSTSNKKAGIQCMDCHSGHVEYINPADIAAGDPATPNVFMLRRYVNYSGGVKLNSYRRKVFMTSTSSQNTLLIGQNNRICQACHNPPNTVPEHSTATKLSDCQGCHTGSSISDMAKQITPPTGCTGCHGSPPQHTTGGANSGGYAINGGKNYNTSGYFKNESTAGHPTHAAGKPYRFACNECHQGNTHDSGTFIDVFATKVGIIAGTSSTFTGGSPTSTCANMYCHSYGTATLTKAKSVTWNNSTRNSIIGSANRCIACHNGVNGGVYNNLSTNSHFQHVNSSGRGIGCVVCHSSTVSSNTVISSTDNHVNGVRNLQVNGSAGGFGTKLNSDSLSATTCTTYCHSDGKGTAPLTVPNWTNRNTGKCNACHITNTSAPTWVSGAAGTSGNAHYLHFSSTATTYGPRLKTNNTACTFCHLGFTETGATHVNGTVNVDTTTSTCATQCHRNSVPTWTSSSRLACESCHDGSVSYDSRAGFNNISAPRKDMTLFGSKGHKQYRDAGSNFIYCLNCHDDTTRHISGVRGDANRLIGGDSNQITLCGTCHNNASVVTNAARRNMVTHVTAKGGPAAGNCSACHDVHGTNNYFSIVKSIKYNTASSAKAISFVNGGSEAAAKDDGTNYVKATGDGLCQICHTKTKYFMRYNRNYGYAGQAGYTYVYPHPSGGVKCLDCHKHNDTYAFKAAGGCDGCHGYPPVPKNFVKAVGNYNYSKFEDYSGGGGSHIIGGHIPAGANPNSGFKLCQTCHTESDHNTSGNVSQAAQIKVQIPSRLRFNSAVLPKYTSNRLNGGSHTVGTCSNVSCHFQKSPKWGNKP